MRTGGWSLLVVGVVLLLPACEVTAGSDDDDEARGTRSMMAGSEVDSIARMVRGQVIEAFGQGAGGATSMPALYTPDAVLSDETERTHAGMPQIQRAFAEGIPEGATLDIRSQGVIGSGDLIVDMGTYTFTMPPQAEGAPPPMRGRYLVALQRMDDGSWKIVRQLTDAVGIGGAAPTGPVPATAAPTGPLPGTDTSDTAAGARPADSAPR